jgi:hypothetical protein
LYNKLSSNNNNNNNHHVSVIQVCVSELTAHRALILYNTYVAVLVLADADVNSVLCWSTAACLLLTLSDNGHSCAAQCECLVCTAMYHIESDENSSVVIHQCNSDSESGVLISAVVSTVKHMYDTLF